MQQACNNALFVELCSAGEIERVDTAERVIRRVPDQLLDRIHHIRVGDLSQRREERFGLAHTLEVGCEKAPEKGGPFLADCPTKRMNCSCGLSRQASRRRGGITMSTSPASNGLPARKTAVLNRS